MTDPTPAQADTIPDYVPPTADQTAQTPLFDPYTGERLAPVAPVQEAAQAVVGDVKTITGEVKDAAKTAFADLVRFTHLATESHGQNIVAAIHALIDAL